MTHGGNVDRRHRHVLIAEKAYGGRLPGGVEVHHIDGDHLNNIPGNLVICQDRKYHQLLHMRQRIIDAGGNPNTQKVCPTCRIRERSEFHPASYTADGLRPNCKDCISAKNRADLEKRKQRVAVGGMLDNVRHMHREIDESINQELMEGAA